jgi:hypothetical protein
MEKGTVVSPRRKIDCGLRKEQEWMEDNIYSMHDADNKLHRWRRAPPCPPFNADTEVTP